MTRKHRTMFVVCAGDRIIAPFRSIHSAESWARATLPTNEWAVEPLVHRDDVAPEGSGPAWSDDER